MLAEAQFAPQRFRPSLALFISACLSVAAALVRQACRIELAVDESAEAAGVCVRRGGAGGSAGTEGENDGREGRGGFVGAGVGVGRIAVGELVCSTSEKADEADFFSSAGSPSCTFASGSSFDESSSWIVGVGVGILTGAVRESADGSARIDAPSSASESVSAVESPEVLVAETSRSRATALLKSTSLSLASSSAPFVTVVVDSLKDVDGGRVERDEDRDGTTEGVRDGSADDGAGMSAGFVMLIIFLGNHDFMPSLVRAFSRFVLAHAASEKPAREDVGEPVDRDELVSPSGIALVLLLSVSLTESLVSNRIESTPSISCPSSPSAVSTPPSVALSSGSTSLRIASPKMPPRAS